MTTRGGRRFVAFALVAVLALIGALFLYLVGIDALEGKNDFQFFADSSTYHEAAIGGLDHVDTLADTVGVAANFLGPLIILQLAADNYYAVLLLNALLLAFSVNSIARSLSLDAVKFLFVLLINPITISSLLSVNKEVLSLVFIALLVRTYTAASIGALLLAVIASMLVRWQLTLVLVIAGTMIGAVNPLREHRGVTLLLLLVVLSVIYVQLAPTLEPILVAFEAAADSYEGSGIYDKLNSLQDEGWYWAVFPVKAAHLMFGMGLRVDRLFNATNIYNDFWQLLHSTALLILFLVLLHVRRFKLGNDLIYLSLIYVAVFAVTPIYTPRYFFPVYVLWAAALCAPSRFPSVFNATQNRRRARSEPPARPVPVLGN